MSFGFSIGDVLVCAKMAWEIYTQIRNAPSEIQTIADDVALLHATLKSMNENVVRSAPLASSDIDGMKMTMERCKRVLKELQPLAEKYGKNSFGLKNRVKFQMEDLKGTQQRLMKALDGLNSFNSAVSMYAISHLIREKRINIQWAGRFL
jgi:hypothetical protein